MVGFWADVRGFAVRTCASKARVELSDYVVVFSHRGGCMIANMVHGGSSVKGTRARNLNLELN